MVRATQLFKSSLLAPFARLSRRPRLLCHSLTLSYMEAAPSRELVVPHQTSLYLGQNSILSRPSNERLPLRLNSQKCLVAPNHREMYPPPQHQRRNSSPCPRGSVKRYLPAHLACHAQRSSHIAFSFECPRGAKATTS